MFKPRLENILKEVVLLSEVAELAAEANRLLSPGAHEPYRISSSGKISLPFADLTWASEKRTEPTGPDDDLTVSSDSLDEKHSEDLQTTTQRCIESSSRRLLVKDMLEKVGDELSSSCRSTIFSKIFRHDLVLDLV
jgi:hypothetical protein